MSRFGDYLKKKRLEKGITTRSMANDLKVSVSYISELESGVKMPPNSSKEGYDDLIDRIISYLDLNAEESNEMKNLADNDLGAKGYLSNDMSKYVDKVPLAMVALRKAKDAKLSDEEWQNIINQIDKGNN